MDECPICFELFESKSPQILLTCCSGQKIHIDCYVKSLPRCPFCRHEQPKGIFPILVTITDWPRIVKSLSLTILVSACFTTAFISGLCSRDCRL